jgi:hypothetical protein
MKAVPNVDLTTLGRGWGWKLEQAQHFPEVRAIAESRGAVAIYQDAGRQDWHTSWGGWPAHFTKVESWPVQGTVAAAIAISDRFLPNAESPPPAIIYRPPTLTLGIHGEWDDTSAEDLLSYVAGMFAQHGLSVLSLTALAGTLQAKDQLQLVDLAEELHIPLLAYPEEKLRQVPMAGGSTSPCALAAMLAAGATQTVAAAIRYGSLTLSVARRTWLAEK